MCPDNLNSIPYIFWMVSSTSGPCVCAAFGETIPAGSITLLHHLFMFTLAHARINKMK